MPDYECYGLLVRSEIAVPELFGSERSRTGHEADVTVELGSLAAAPAQDLSMVRAGRLWVGPTAMRLQIEGTATCEVRDGRRIIVDPAAVTQPEDHRLSLFGWCLGAVLHQRGLLVLHGCSVRIGDSCAVVVGRSGAGKSTVAAEFVRRGLDLLDDDTVPVDDLLRAVPGLARTKLWADAVDRFGIDVRDLRRVRAQGTKYDVPVQRGALAPLPVRWVYVLETWEERALQLEPAQGLDRFDLLWQHSHRRGQVQGFTPRAAHLERCHRLQAQARMVRVLRPRGSMTSGGTATAILDDIAGHAFLPDQQPLESPPQEAP